MTDPQFSSPGPLAVAVVGMAAHLPGARTIEEFWGNLRDGVESVHKFTPQELVAAGVSPALLQDPNYVKAGAILNDIEMFDASFFGFSPKDAAIMDPQHRHFLECAWEALEHSGYTPETFRGSIGVYAGSGMNTYLIYNLLTNRELVESAGLFLIRQTGNDKDVLATRASYQLNLHGPSISIQTACSTSLVAIHSACQSLLNRECDLALAGGVTIEIPHRVGYLYRDGEILSQDGHCRSFDARSTGTVFGSGAGVVILRRLQDAVDEGDTIHAIIRGSAINNDGSRKVGYLAPSVEGQAEVIREALLISGVPADSVSYVETHGTGTRVGDPIEITALTQAFREFTDQKGFCAIGSVKTNIGHLDAAAGVAGFIKTVLALKHGWIPPSLHFERPNPLIDFASSPFYVNANLQKWQANGAPRRAGVTSLGIGGTNAHLILEESLPMNRSRNHRPWQLVTLSARSANAAEAVTRNLASYLTQNPELNLADVSFTLQLGRKPFRHRRAFVCRSVQEGITALESSASIIGEVQEGQRRPVVFLFPGQGAQYVNMGRELYEREEEFRRHVVECCAVLTPHLGLDLRTILYPPEDQVDEATRQLNQTRLTQPALFVVEYALAKLWLSWGIQPDGMVGHSIGEYVAACLAGVFSLESALSIVAARGRLMQSLPGGVMTAVPISEERVRPFLSDDTALASINSPEQCVVSGSPDAVDSFERRIATIGVPCRRLHTSHAFHSHMMDPILEEFANVVRGFELHAPKIPYLSNVSGTWITEKEVHDPEYWSKHLRAPVRFSDTLFELFRKPEQILLEVGPGHTLSALARQNPKRPKQQKVLQSMRHPNDRSSDQQILLTTLGQLWTAGSTVDWEAFRSLDNGYRVPLPTYPFERQRYWIEPGNYAFGASQRPASAKASETEASLRFYRPTWTRASLGPVLNTQPAGAWLVLSEGALGHALAERLRTGGDEVTTVTAGDELAIGGRECVLRIGNPDDYKAVFSDFIARHQTAIRIVHTWSLNAQGSAQSPGANQDLNFYSLLLVAQALGREGLPSAHLAVISNRIQQIGDEPVLAPETGLLVGACKVIAKEYPEILCRNIDIARDSGDLHVIAQQIVNELTAQAHDQVTAYRGSERWIETYEPFALDVRAGKLRLKNRGVYLITGGLGGIALTLADRLAREFHARLILTGRTDFPQRHQWDEWLAKSDPGPIGEKIRKIQSWEQQGAEVLVIRADVTNREEMSHAISAARDRLGALDGVFHAAGVLHDGPLQLKTRETASAVLAPKTTGTLVLDELLKDIALDFFVLFSSISSVSPPPGQIDYAAANAFLDAFARSRLGHLRQPTIAINWPRWLDVGMAAQHESGSISSPPSRHFNLEEAASDSAGQTAYTCSLNSGSHWVLNEHRFNGGKALFPGTGYLELAHSGIAPANRDAVVEFQDVVFSAPFAFDHGETRELRLELDSDPNAGHFSVMAPSGDDGKWQEYSSGSVRQVQPGSPPRIELEKIQERCRARTIDFRGRKTKQERYFLFGPRWRSLQTVYLGKTEGLSALELPPEFRADLGQCRLHPALFDIATGSALYVIPDYDSSDDLYLPLSYRRITAWRRLPGKIFSHFRIAANNSRQQDFVTFDVSILDESGNCLIEIEGFTLRRIDNPTAMVRNFSSPRIVSNERSLPRAHDGLLASQGWDVLRQVLSLPDMPPTLVVSPVELNISTSPRPSPSPVQSRTQNGPAPQSRSESVATPKDDIEQTLAHWWGELLGIETVGIRDDFFELGGHSLIAVRLFTKIRKTYQVDLGLSTLFEVRNIEKLAALIRAEIKGDAGSEKEWSSLVSIQSSGSRPPLFFISGITGNVLHFQRLVKYLDPNQPVYALQPPGLDGRQGFLTRMEELAAYYLQEIKKVQSHGPYYLAGYSFGGFVTFEMAQQLYSQGEELGLLLLLDTIEWHYWAQVKRSLTVTDRITLDATRFLGALREPNELREGIRNFRHNMFLRLYRVAQRFPLLRRHFGAISPALTTAVATEHANWKMAADYVPQTYRGQLTLIRCSERSRSDGDDRLLGWGHLADGIDVQEVPGDHLSIIKEPKVRILAETLERCLETAQARSNNKTLV